MINARRLMELGIVWTGLDRLAARGRRGRRLVLAYHNIVPDTADPIGDQSLHLSRAKFAEQLDLLARFCDVIPLKQILEERPAEARPAVAITFDDGYRGASTLGAAELRARELPATMFVVPGLLGGRSFWWDALAGSDGLSDSVRQHCLEALRGDGDAVRTWAAGAGRELREMPEWGQSASASDLEQWACGQLTVGAHTWRHLNLTCLGAGELDDELTQPLVWLRHHLGTRVLPWLTYPYGLANSTTIVAAQKAGYEAALVVTGGWVGRSRSDTYLLPRLNIPAGLTAAGFRLRLAGIIGSPVASTQQWHSAPAKLSA